MVDYAQARRNMVDTQIRPNAVTDRRILSALLEVPREAFLPAGQRSLAYIDEDLPLTDAAPGTAGRYLMEPMPFARLVQLAEIAPGDLVLDVGCATGYSTAILARLADSVVGLECEEELARIADETLVELGVGNAAVVRGALQEGCQAQAPFDAIIVGGAVEEVPDALLAQLRDGGRLVAPVLHGPVGKATLFRSIHGDISSRIAFDVAVRPLPGFSRPPAFVF